MKMYQKLKKCKSIKEIYEVIPEKFYEKCAVVLIFLMNMVVVVESLTKIIYNKGSYWKVMQNYNLFGKICLIYVIIYIGSRICKLKSDEINKYFKNNIWDFCFLMLFLLSVVSITVAHNKTEAINGDWYRQNGIRAYVVYLSLYIIGKSIDTEKYKRFIFWTMTIASTLQCILIYKGYVNDTGRYAGIFGNSNHCGYFMTMAIFAMIGLLVTEKSLIVKCIMTVIYGFNIMCLILNNTFGCYLAVIAGIVFYVVVSAVKNRKNQSLIYYILMYIHIIFVFVMISIITDMHTGIVSNNFNITGNDIVKVTDRSEEAGNAGTGRWKLWIHTMKIIKRKPILGCGPENIQFEPGYKNEPHNEFIQIAAEHGVPACLFYILGLITLMIHKIKNLKNESEYTIICGAIVFAYLISSMFGVMMFYTAVFYYTFLGMVSKNRNLTQHYDIGENT